ncbi:MAG: amidase [Gammaproteobacteria bacterium]|nr:amidase [Gammaproteobacteria bacterium]MDH4253356.1 amidase [Gammaproteobacteria bacterium]MDH5310130.1 amidase [Gammaproteobacteria bacterium]
MLSRRVFIGGVSGSAVLAATRALAEARDLCELSVAEASALIRAREISPVELARAYLDRIDRLDSGINAYVTVTRELALRQAAQRAAEIAQGRWRGPLHGIPIGLKDNIDTAGIPTTAASAVLADRVPASDARVWQLLAEAGAVLLGKLNMHEFAYGGTSAITHFGPVHNPWNPAHIPGGSSGGSAAAVAARLCAAALGTDTLASIRLPAAYCGVVGFKPTHGLASIRGIIPVSETLDHVGPLTRTVADAALLLQGIAGYDPADPVSIRVEPTDYAAFARAGLERMRIGVVRKPYFDDLDPDVASAMEDALDALATIGAGLREVDLPPHPDFPVLLAEAHAWHAPYLAEASSRDLYHPVTLERIVAAGGFSTDDYIAVRRDVELARRAIAAVFEEVDVLVTPTAPGLPETIRNAVNPAEATGAEPSVRNTFAFNIFGIPTISVPCGYSESGLPIGLQISGPAQGETRVLALAHAYEQARAWHTHRPPIA